MPSPNRKERTLKEKIQRSLPLIIMFVMLALVIGVTVISCVKAIGGTSAKTSQQPVVVRPIYTEMATTAKMTTATTTTKATTTAKPKETFAFLVETTSATEATTTTTSMTLSPRTAKGMELSFYQAIMNVGDAPILPVAFMTPSNALDTRIKMESSDEDVAIVTEDNRISAVGAGNCVITVTAVANPAVTAEIVILVQESDVVTTPEFSNPSQTTYTLAVEVPEDVEEEEQEVPEIKRDDIIVINGITYVKGIMLVNKTYPLPESYNPAGMTPETAKAFKELQQAAKNEAKLDLYSHSDFRSYRSQAVIYQGYAARDGWEEADRYSARAGYSEHQTGMVIDVNDPSYSFNGTKEAIWLEKNCWKYGFIIRFPQEKEEFTGYEYESWHIRYVGKAWAKTIHDSGLSLEEFLNVRSQYP